MYVARVKSFCEAHNFRVCCREISTSFLLCMPQESNHFVKRITLECVVEKYLLPLSIVYAARVKSFCEAHNFRVCCREISTSFLLCMPQESNHFVKRITFECVVEKYLLPLYYVCRKSQIIL